MTTCILAGLARYPRFPLLHEATPIERLARLEQHLAPALNGVQLYVKRDDHMRLGGGGNKLRKLEFLLGQALADGADTVITVGGLQSNHARLTAAAAALAGLQCELVLTRQVQRDDADYEYSGNVLLDGLFGARVHALPGSVHGLAWANERADALRAQGRKVAVLPTGGSTPLGSLGYAVCAQEIVQQSQQMGLAFQQVIVPNGSAGTHAGLSAGFAALGLSASLVRSHAVLADAPVSRQRTWELAQQALALLGSEANIALEEIDVDGAQRGAGYGATTPAMLDAVRLLARTQGLLLDPVYSGKAFAGMLADIAAGRYAPGQSILFVMTGGTPGLYAYRATFG
ncbi:MULTISPECIES: D-cysteine desulfhydrase family protein [unclassified Janthinobacterium]|uniref:D-cysteine desulfhydrase family protein n=1 Tax=unclassified Janthinobacterium TaxID=2610881 RepID=UPI00161FBD74|nr:MULTISPECIES: D-cysteine desulfhydrase family protein [unclassified Janthinobacterium]MBB5608660.1 D-cysteine desulfhydrase [Janthinobacterium sp. S3T4]MBB5613937.1 D-cysteine desulfhydrase [Janthinobacterium sp. S3M3]